MTSGRQADDEWGAAADVFDVAWQALVEADLSRLEELAADGPFPCSLDGWVRRPWLTTAIHAGNPASVAWVLSKGPEVDHIDGEGFTALKAALQMEIDCRLPPAEAAALTIRLIDLLLDAGADVNQPMTLYETALHVAAFWSSPTVVRHLLARGADPFAVSHDYLPQTPADVAKAIKRWDVHAVLREAMDRASPAAPR